MEDTAAAEKHVPKRRRPLRLNDQQAPPVGGNGDDPDLDLISRLPDAILGTVVSLLPTKDGARTQALSRRWLPLWRSHMAPLNLLADRHLPHDRSRAAVISKILSDHPGPARRFSLDIVFRTGSMFEVARWFRSTSLAGLQELQVSNLGLRGYLLPPHALIRFAPSLRLLKLFRCRFPDQAALPSFSLLEQLILHDVDVSDDALQSMISGCAVLKSVSLHKMRFGRRLCISSPTLRSISFYLPPVGTKGVATFQELVIEDASCLKRLLPFFPEYGPATIRKMIAVSLTTKMRTVKILAVNISANLDECVDFLKCFPCLEKLYIILLPQKDTNDVRKYDPLDPIECFELHLKKVALKNYDGNKRPCIDFAKFFILNVKGLKEMEIGVLNREIDKWMCYQRSQLQLENRASRDAQIVLKRDGYVIPTDQSSVEIKRNTVALLFVCLMLSHSHPCDALQTILYSIQ